LRGCLFFGFQYFPGLHHSNRRPLHPAQKRRLALSPTLPVSIAIAGAIAVAAISVSTAMAVRAATTAAVTTAIAILAAAVTATVVAVSVAAVPSGAAIAALIPSGTAVRAAIVISGPTRVAAAVPGTSTGKASGLAGAPAVARPAGAAISTAPSTSSAGGGLAALPVVSCAEVGVIEDVGEIRGNLSKRVLHPVRHTAHARDSSQADQGTQQRDLEEVVSLLAGGPALDPMAQSEKKYFHEILVQIGRTRPFILLCLGHYLSQSMPFR
jgi:hypothetical protein